MDPDKIRALCSQARAHAMPEHASALIDVERNTARAVDALADAIEQLAGDPDKLREREGA